MTDPANGTHAMIELLDASGPDEEHAEALMLFGQFIGSWDVEATYWDHAGTVTGEGTGEWHFGWVLQGRAIQDVLIGPPLEEQRRTGAPVREYGSSFRMYEPRTGTWRVTWFAPVSGTIVDLVARSVEAEIVLDGVEPDGMLDRWVFSDITSDTFTWTGYESEDEGTTWPLVERMMLSRRS